MAPKDRPNSISVRLSDEEAELREALEKHLGIDGASVMRQGLLKLGRDEGFEFPVSRGNKKSAKT
jgi:hypothetical protein